MQLEFAESPSPAKRTSDRMRIAIISTVGDCSWAGSEEMWKLFAIEALRRGHSVGAMLQTPIAQSEELAEFRALGGVVFAYNPLHRVHLVYRAPREVFPVLED